MRGVDRTKQHIFMRGVIVPPSKFIVYTYVFVPPPKGGLLLGGFIIKG